MARYWQLLVKAQGDTKNAQKAMRQFSRASKDLRDAVGINFGGIAKASALAFGVAIGASVKIGIDEMLEAQAVTAQTNAVLKSTGGVANVTASQIQNLANSLSQKSGVDDEVIQSGQNILATFTNVRNEVGKNNDIFNQATSAALDMSVAMKTDLKSANIQVGKALNDPVKGITALTRVGVSFTDQQKSQIKTLVASGRTMDAQKIILAELNKEFGGSAEAAGKTSQGAINRLKNSYAELSAAIIQQVLPSIASLAERLNALVIRMQKWAASDNGKKTLAQIRAAMQNLADTVDTVIQKIVAFGRTLVQHRNIVIPLVKIVLALIVAYRVLKITIAAVAATKAAYNVIVIATTNAAKGLTFAKKALIVTLKALKVALKAVGWLAQKMAILAYKASLVALRVAMIAYRGAAIAAAVATRVLTAAMKANPIGLIITAIVILIGLFVVLYQRNEGFRNAVKASVVRLKEFAKAGIQALQIIIQKMQPVISLFMKLGSIYIRGVIAYFRLLWNVAQTAWNIVRNSWSKATYLFSSVKDRVASVGHAFAIIISIIASLPGKVAVKAVAIGRAIVDGIKNTIRNNASSIIKSVTDIGNRAVSAIKDKLTFGNGGKKSKIKNVSFGEGVVSGMQTRQQEISSKQTQYSDALNNSALSRNKTFGNTYNVQINTNQKIDSVSFMRSLRTASQIGTV